MKRFLATAFVLACAVSGPVFANAELAKSKNCMGCHAIDKKILGPSFKEVAAKYAGQKDAEAKLIQKVIKGGAGAWGDMAMPPNAISENEARTLVKWVLSQK